MHVHGIGIGRGIAVGRVLRMPDPLPEPTDEPSTLSVAQEEARSDVALRTTAAALRELSDASGDDARAILEAQALMAADPAVIDEISHRIHAGKTAERSVFEAFQNYRELLESIGGYMAARAADLDDVSRRVIAAIAGAELPKVPSSDRPFVLVAHDLAPADTALLDLTMVLAVVTRDGGPTSHTAILARSRSLVAVVGAGGSDQLADGDSVIVDASAGTVIAEPSAAEIATARDRAERPLERAPLTPGALKDGTPVALLANLNTPDDAEPALELGAEGVGLLRTEFLFLDAEAAPSIQKQRAHYERIMRPFAGKRVVVRVLDAGADKKLRFLGVPREENPALGNRGIRALRAAESVLRDQLQALHEAAQATGADVWTMAPMVADAGETTYFVDLCREYGLRAAGVTVEVPSAALLADQIVPLTDFVSIGTNDLTQYTLAADRMLGSVSGYQDPWHPSVLRLIKLIGDAGRAAGIPVGVCGESAADPLFAVLLVGLGATDLSMSAPALAGVRAELLCHTLDEARQLAELALQARSAAEAREAVSSAVS